MTTKWKHLAGPTSPELRGEVETEDISVGRDGEEWRQISDRRLAKAKHLRQPCPGTAVTLAAVLKTA